MAPNATIVQTDRVRKVKIRPYDQVFALTQYIINDGLQTHWQRLCDADPKLATKLSVSQPGAGSIINAALDSPRIMVEADYDEDLSGVLYTMRFKSGKFELRIAQRNEDGEAMFDDDDRPIEEVINFNMEGWSTRVKELVSDEFKRLVLDAGQYSLNNLIAKFDTAVFMPEKSIYGKKTWDSFPKNVQAGLDFCFKNMKSSLLERLKKADIIGSALKSTRPEDSSKPAMTFEPHKIQYQTYPWVDPGAMEFKPSSGFIGNQRLNYMLYCETTNKRDLPPIHQRSLERLGNWTDGRLEADKNSENCEFGSFHMARENFFDGYLLKHLRFLNRAMEPWTTRHHIRLRNIINIEVDWESDMAIGSRPDKTLGDPHYDFKQVTDTEWQFNSSVTLDRVEDRAGHKGWSGEGFVDTLATSRNIIKFVPGSDIIEVSGTTSVKLDFEFIDKKIIGANKEYIKKLHFDVNWGLKLDLEAVNDGGLQILTTFSEPQVTFHRQDLADDFGTTKALLEGINNAITNTASLKAALAQDLSNKQGLVLPAAGTFFFKNPILSHRGDLICSIAYSNIAPEKALDPNDPTIINPNGKPRITV
ncbi:hypothetical protein Neosp_009796 [[Neocosmospora] mangrovei]